MYQHEQWMPQSPNWNGLPIWRHCQNGHHRSEITILSITQQLGLIETIFFKWVHILVTWQAAIFPQLYGQVSMTLVTTRFVVCHQLLFEVQQSLRTNLSWYMWWMKSGTQMPLLQSLCWERCSVLQGHNYLLDDGITINRYIWAVFGSGRDIHISTALYCAYAEKALERLLETSGCKGCWGSFTIKLLHKTEAFKDAWDVPAMMDEEECGGSSCSHPEGEMWWHKLCHNLELKCRP